MEPTPEGFRRLIEEIVDSRLNAWQKATVAIATPPVPEPAPSGWITDRVPTAKDGNQFGCVRIPVYATPTGDPTPFDYIQWSSVHPGTPWSNTCSEPGPWDSTCLDHNGWIRSRLPDPKNETSFAGNVLIPVRCGLETAVINHALIAPGQPWAPWGGPPGPYQP
jgi:hypothetical protein